MGEANLPDLPQVLTELIATPHKEEMEEGEAALTDLFAYFWPEWGIHH